MSIDEQVQYWILFLRARGFKAERVDGSSLMTATDAPHATVCELLSQQPLQAPVIFPHETLTSLQNFRFKEV